MNITKWMNEKFIKIADAVSFGMGTPTNIIFWLLVVFVWFLLGYFRREMFVNGTFLPEWFTSTAWNFPLNTVTTLMELYIGFLVAAAANRSEREIRKIIEAIKSNVEEIERINHKQNQILEIVIKHQEKELAKDNQIIHQIKEINGETDKKPEKKK